MPITGQFVLSYRDQLAAFWSQSRLLRILAWILLGCFVFLLAMALVNDMDDDQIEPLGMMLAFFLVWPAIIGFGFWRLSPQQRQVRYEIDDERVRLRDAAGNEISSPWSEIRSCSESASGFVIRIGPGARWLCKRAFAPDALAAFRKLARAKLGANARVAE